MSFQLALPKLTCATSRGEEEAIHVDRAVFWRPIASVLVVMVLVATASAQDVRLYVTDGEVGLIELDPATAAATRVGDFGLAFGNGVMAGLAYDARSDRLYGTATRTDRLFEINRATGQATLIGPLAGPVLMHGLAFDRTTGWLYGAYGVDSAEQLYRIDPATGTATAVGSIGDFGADGVVSGLAFHPVTNVLYGTTGGSTAPAALLTIDTQTGRGSLVAPTQRLTGLAFHPLTHALYGVDNGLGSSPDSLYVVDINTGASTFIGRVNVDNALGLEFVPEPTGAMASAAALVLLLRRRARRPLV